MIIYKTTNLLDGTIYVGKDARNIKSYLGSGLYLKNAIKKYGKENFKKEEIDFANSISELNEKEIYWINYYRSTNVKMYNLADGGNGGDLTKFRDPANMKKGWDEKYGKEVADVRRKLQSERFSGESNPMYGKQLSDEHREILRKYNTGITRNFSEDECKNRSERMKGKKWTNDMRNKRKLSDAKKIMKECYLIVDGDKIYFPQKKKLAEYLSVSEKVLYRLIRNKEIQIEFI